MHTDPNRCRRHRYHAGPAFKGIAGLLGMLATLCHGTPVADAAPTVDYTAGHADIALTYDASAPSFALNYTFYTSAVPTSLRNTTRPPAEILSVVPDNQSGSSSTSALRPPGGEWDFIGVAAGQRFWFLPASNKTAVPYLGVSAEGLGSTTDWQGLNPTILFSIVGVTQKPLPTSVVSAWDFGNAGGALRVLWSTATDPWTNAMSPFVGSHSHYNIGFTDQGRYEVELQASGTRADGMLVISPPARYFFEVVPEPAGLAAAGIGLVALAALRQRRRSPR